MKVLLAGHMVGQGGIQSHLYWLGQMLSEEGIEVLALSLNGNVETSQVPNGVRCVAGCETSKRSFLAPKVANLLHFTESVKDFSPDIYLAVGTGWNLFLPPLLAGVKGRRIFHEVMSGRLNRWSSSRWAVKWWFDEVVGQSNLVAEAFAESCDWPNKVAVLPAVPEPLEITANLPKVQQKRVPLGTAKVAMFSRLVPHKRGLWLVQQWDDLKDHIGELHIHGRGPEEELIRNYIQKKGIGDRVKCFGAYPAGQAYVDLLSRYDLTLLPTVGAEGAPLVLLESMACGVPFVAYGVGGIPDYGTNNPNVRIVAPEPWITDQAKTYASVESLILSVPFDLETLSDNERHQVAIKTTAFSTSVKSMLESLDRVEINQSELQQYYFNHYSYSVLKTAWISYLCKP